MLFSWSDIIFNQINNIINNIIFIRRLKFREKAAHKNFGVDTTVESTIMYTIYESKIMYPIYESTLMRVDINVKNSTIMSSRHYCESTIIKSTLA